MIFEILSQDNVEDYIAYLKVAMSEEPDKMTVEEIDEQGIKSRISDSCLIEQPLFSQKKMVSWSDE